MVSKTEIESFLKINYHDIEVGKIYKHSKEWKQCWEKIVNKHGFLHFCYHNFNNPSTPIDMDSVFILANKELDESSKKTIIYTILYKEKMLNRYFHFDFSTLVFSKKPILKLVST